MNSTDITKGILRAILIIAGIILLAYLLYETISVLVYLVLAGVVALIGRPVVLTFRRKLHFPNTLAVVATMFFMVALIGGIIALFVPLITEQGRALSLLNIEELQRSLNVLYWEISQATGASPETVNEFIEEADIEENVIKGLDLAFIPNILNSFVDILSTFSIGLFSVLFISFFFLKDSRMLERGILIFIPESQQSKVVNSIESIKNLLSRYFLGLVIQILVLFTIYTITLLIVGIENAVVIAFLCALFNIIPYVGPIIGGVIMILLTMTSNLGYDFSTVVFPKTGWVFLGLVIGQLVDNFISQPLIFSNSVKSHPLEIFLIIIIFGLLFGVVGMIVAVPGYTVLKVFLKEFMADNAIVRNLTRGI